jgi:hypothetical protein
MSTKTITAKYINQGKRKDGNPYWNIKDNDGETYWSKTGEPHPNVAPDAQYEVDYSVSKSGFNNIIALRPASDPKPPTRAQMAPKDALGAFRTTAFCAFVKAGMVTLDTPSIREALRKIEAGYLQATASPLTQSGRDYADDMDDEIPDFGARQ